MFAFSPENTSMNSRYSSGIGSELSSGAFSTLRAGIALVNFPGGLLSPVKSFIETLNVVLPGSWHSLPRVRALTNRMSILFVSRVSVGLGGCRKVIFVSVQSIIGLFRTSQSYPNTTEYSSSKFVTKNSNSCFSPVENVIGIRTFFSTVDVEDPSNILNGIAFSKYEKFSLFVVANASFTKLWDDPESNRARNGREGFRDAGDVRERKNEFGESDVVFKRRGVVLLVVGQLFRSTKEGLPSRFLPLWAPTEASAPFVPPLLPWSDLRLFLSYLPGNLTFCDHLFRKPGTTCSAGVEGVPLASTGCLFRDYDCWSPSVSRCSRKFLLMV